MAKLPDSLGFLRNWIHSFRLLLLGPEWRSAVTATPVNQTSGAMNALDRLAVLESQVNWRLLGMPARVENLKMEQLPLLADAGTAEAALTRLKASQRIPLTIIKQACASAAAKTSVFAVSSWSAEENDTVYTQGKVKFLVVDPTELFGQPSRHAIESTQTVHTSVIDAAARLTRAEFDFIWLSSAAERLTPLQLQTLFLQVKTGLLPNGTCSGYFADYPRSDAGAYWTHPSRLRPITKTFVEQLAKNAGFSSVTFHDEAQAEGGVSYCLFEIKAR